MKKHLLTTALALALSSTSAFAVVQQTGIYGTVLGGWSFANSPTASQVGASSSNNGNYTWGGNLGYQFAFNDNWATGLEMGYVSFGQTNYTGTSSGNIENTGAQVMAVFSGMMHNGLNAFLKAGAIDEYSQTNNPSTNGITPTDQGNTKLSEWLPAGAVGIGYMPKQNLNLAIQYEYTWGQNWNNSTSAVTKPMTQNAVTLNLTYILGF